NAHGHPLAEDDGDVVAVLEIADQEEVRRGADDGAQGPDGGGVGDAEHECGAEVRLDHCPEAAVVGFRLVLVSDFGPSAVGGPGVVGGPSTVCGAIGEGGPHHFGHDHEHRDA